LAVAGEDRAGHRELGGKGRVLGRGLTGS
jgi:hypothetical protein